MARRDFSAPEKPADADTDVKDTPKVDEDKDAVEKPKPKPQLIRQGRPRMANRPAPKTKAPVTAKKPAELVKKHVVKGKVIPGITRPPKKTNRARITETGREKQQPYWKQVAENMGF